MQPVIGRLVNMSGSDLILATNPIDPGGSQVNFPPDTVTNIAPSPVSLMPPGLLNSLYEADAVFVLVVVEFQLNEILELSAAAITHELTFINQLKLKYGLLHFDTFIIK